MNNQEIFTQAQRILASILIQMGFDINLELTINSEKDVYINISCQNRDDVSHLIGKGEQTLDAIEHIFWQLMRLQIPREELEEYRINIDVDGVRKQKNQMIVDEARKIAQSVKETGKKVRLPSMNSHRRWLIHNMILNEFPELVTKSTGTGDRRSIEIYKK